MKKTLLLAAFAFTFNLLKAQVPQQVNYQGIARNSIGNIIANQNISLRLSIREGTPTGAVVYRESHSLKTNTFGIFTTSIGSPNATNKTGSFSTINWATGTKFLQVEIDVNGGGNFIDLGTSQLLSVPYALYAGSAVPSGVASGDLTGTYPSPVIKNNSITTEKILDGVITSEKLAPGVIPTSLQPSGNAGGDLAGAFPNPVIADGAVVAAKLADGSVGTSKIKDSSVTAAKLASGVIPSTLPPSGLAGGDLTGSFPNPTLANDVVGSEKIRDGAVTSTKIENSAIDQSKLADNAVGTSKLQDGSVTAAKLAPGVIPSSMAPSGTAGGDLSGSFPNPTLASGVVNTAKIADAAIITTKIEDGAVTSAKLAAGVIPTTLPPSGIASGDLSGNYPNPVVAKIKGIALSSSVPSAGQVLKYDGTNWSPSPDLSFSLPHTQTLNLDAPVFSLTNEGTGTTITGVNASKSTEATAILGTILSTSAADGSAGVKGIHYGSADKGFGVWGQHNGTGSGVYGSSTNGTGINGHSTLGTGVNGFTVGGTGVAAYSETGFALSATSDLGLPAFFNVVNTDNPNPAVMAMNSGDYGHGVMGIGYGTYSHGIVGIANYYEGVGVDGLNNADGDGVFGQTYSDIASGVAGRNDGAYAGVKGINGGYGGIGVIAIANADGAANGNALVAELETGGSGNTAVFKAGGANVARIDHTGKAFFNGSTQVGGADVAEYFDVEGAKSVYEPGDVLAISESNDRKVEKSSTPYSTLVAGVYATKPGLLLTEKNAENDNFDQMVPMGVVGVIPTKVCLEDGEIKRGDLLVTSSIPGVAMKADPDKVKVGQVIGKALQNYNNNTVGKINVLVSIK